jgi:hypothetical protein
MENVKLSFGCLSVELRIALHGSDRVRIDTHHGDLFYQPFIRLGVCPDSFEEKPSVRILFSNLLPFH